MLTTFHKILLKGFRGVAMKKKNSTDNLTDRATGQNIMHVPFKRTRKLEKKELGLLFKRQIV